MSGQVMQKYILIKTVIVFTLGLLLLIPVSMVEYKVHERQGFQEEAERRVAESWTGQQQVVTPVIVIPYTTRVVESSGFFTPDNKPLGREREQRHYSVILPETLDVEAGVDNKKLDKGIYKIPVYSSIITMAGEFNAEQIRQVYDEIKGTRHFAAMDEAFIVVSISDMRGIDSTPVLTVGGQPIAVKPGSNMTSFASGLHAPLLDLNDSESLDFYFRVSLRGMRSLAFVPMAQSASLAVQSGWPHPKFIGASLPGQREISALGFTANWNSSRYSADYTETLMLCLNESNCQLVDALASGVEFIEAVDVYLQSERAIKYAVLFIGLIFVSFFIFEHLSGNRIHPVQYSFVGLATAVFYLLLISLSEHISFFLAYLIAVISCVILILFYVRYVLRSYRAAMGFSAMLATLYGLLYVIVQAEDFALLMGAVLVFAVLAILMLATRKVDWYNLAPPQLHSQSDKRDL